MGKSNFVEAEEASPPRHPALALESVCIFYMQSVQKGVKERRGEERKKFRADCESWGGGDTVGRKKEVGGCERSGGKSESQGSGNTRN